MAIDVSSNYSNPVTQLKVAYVQSYCSSQGSCPDGWQEKITKNYKPDLPKLTTNASADTLAPSEKVPDMRAAAPVPEADLKHNGERSGVHGAAIVAAVTGQAIANPSPQMREAQASLPPKVKAEGRQARIKVLRKKHQAARHHEHHHQMVARADGDHERGAKAVHHYKTAMANHHHHAAPPVIVARSVVAPEMSRPEIFLKVLREKGPLKAFAYLGGSLSNPLA
jgi:hypothetical protein